MYIHSLNVRNFKCLRQNNVIFKKPDGLNEGSGLNILVGENNSGKSSFIEAIHFLRNKGKDVKTIGLGEAEDADVSITFTGDIESVVANFVQDNKQPTFRNRIYQVGAENFIQVRRSFKNEEDIKNVLFFNNETGEFRNETGIDAPFQKFFQISNIWADTNPSNESKFGASTVCGNLLADISDRFKTEHHGQYDEFIRVFNATFNNEDSGLQADLNSVALETQEVLNEQFGRASLKFKFDNPEASILFKNIKIFVDDGQETEITEKGHGLQRAVIISLLQVYARRISQQTNDNGELVTRPHYLFIDEPELGLHPQAQRKLFDALMVISKTHQVFITTHSENFVNPKVLENIYRFTPVAEGIDISFLGTGDDISIVENRQFFFHHHKLFFAKKAIFVEGIDDYERYPKHMEGNGMKSLARDLQLLNGCNSYKVFDKFCRKFHINCAGIFDLDVISITSSFPTNLFPTQVIADIQQLNKTITKKDPTNLLDANLTPAEIALKSKIINELRLIGVYVLHNGAIEHYLDDVGSVIDGNPIKTDDLLSIYAALS